MNRTSKLLQNIILFAIGTFAPKFLSFFLVPIYTSCLSTEAYGVSDLLTTVYSLILPIFTLDISDAILIYTIERKSYGQEKDAPLKYGIQILLKSLLFLGIIFLIIAIIGQNLTLSIYIGYIFFQYFVSAIYSIFLAYLRGIDNIPVVIIAGIINSLVTIFSNILFIVFLNLGLYGLLSASILGGLVADLFIAIKIQAFKIYTLDISLLKNERREMLNYSIPLIFSGLAWWINTSSDRLFVSAIIGTETNGIYAIANKIPIIINALNNVICQAMQLSVFSEVRSVDKNTYLKRLYEMYYFLLAIACSILILLDKILARILFKGDFYIAWKYSPALLIAATMFSMSGYLTTIYSAEKRTKLITKAVVIGAGINCGLNILFIPRFELYGAVVATVISYFIIFFIMLCNLQKVLLVNLGIGKSLTVYFLLVFQWILLLFLENSYGFQVMISLMLCLLYRKGLIDLVGVVKNILVKIKKRSI